MTTIYSHNIFRNTNALDTEGKLKEMNRVNTCNTPSKSSNFSDSNFFLPYPVLFTQEQQPLVYHSTKFWQLLVTNADHAVPAVHAFLYMHWEIL